ncbi:MAG: recombination regulator RecX [Clostridiales bacterium]|nr:recombination regulator RecX [Clostridiales bacterium]
MMPKVDRVEPSKHVRGRFLVFLDTGSLIKVGEQELLDFGLRPGLELEGETLQRLIASSEDTSARERAARMIGARPLSRAELVDKLVAKGEGRPQAERAADWLEELGALNDGEYARTVVRHYDRRGYGPQKLREELYRRKIPRDCWAEALAEARPEEEAAADYLASRGAADASDPRSFQRQANALRRRGFSWQAIRTVMGKGPSGEDGWD